MPIILNISGEAQTIQFQDPIMPEDLSALRLKLDQKILQGRNCYVFDLSSLDFGTTKHLTEINELMDFCLLRKSKVHAVCKNKGDWKKIASKTNFKIEKHLSLDEITSGARSSLEGSHSANPELQKIIAEYQRKAIEKNYDPRGLQKTLENYKSNPTKDHLKSLEAAVLDHAKLQEENTALNHYVSELADEVYELTRLRKSALNKKEIELRKMELDILLKIAEIDQELLRINYG